MRGSLKRGRAAGRHVVGAVSIVGLASVASLAWVPPARAADCGAGWAADIDRRVAARDGQGHGPDLGSDEWKSSIEFRLGVRGRADLPPRDAEAWCRAIDKLVAAGRAKTSAASAAAAKHAGPAFDCRKASGSVEQLICGDPALSALDRRLAEVYAAASAKAAGERPPLLRAEQRGWVKGRNDCWKSDDRTGCVRDEYQHRIVELQARYRLVAATGPVRYACNGSPANEVVATWFATDPPSLMAERGDQCSLMLQQPAGSGTRYVGRNESLEAHEGEVTVVWGSGPAPRRCRTLP